MALLEIGRGGNIVGAFAVVAYPATLGALPVAPGPWSAGAPSVTHRIRHP